MRIARFLSKGKVRLGTPINPREAVEIIGDFPGPFSIGTATLPIEKLLAPIVPTDILCIGLNYHAHAKETGGTVPENPMLFTKTSNALSAPFAPIIIPDCTTQIDYEAELAVVIARDAKNVSVESALDYVFGYTCANDVSARDWQKNFNLNGGQFTRGKSFDTFAPIGPWIVTADEIPDPQALAITCTVSGEVLQSASTADMIFSVKQIVSSLSRTMTLRARSVILTGTPSGVGAARKPPRWLVAGDVVAVEIEKIGRLENPVIN